MTLDQYQKLAARTINSDLTNHEKAIHALLGMSSEIGELQGLHQKVFQGHELDKMHAKKELGDALWFIAEYCEANGWSLDDICQTNIDKLMARYPNGFESTRSIHRVEGDI